MRYFQWLLTKGPHNGRTRPKTRDGRAAPHSHDGLRLAASGGIGRYRLHHVADPSPADRPRPQAHNGEMDAALHYRRFRFHGRDHTSLVGWCNDADGPPLLVANGLGTPPEAWPRLLSHQPDYHVAGWNHRGGLGSDRPADPTRITVADHVDDAFALMDHIGWQSTVVVGWSIGVNVAFEMAAREPHRVDGIVALAGVPGGTFEAGFAPLMVPKPLRRHVSMGVVQAGKLLGTPLTALAQRVPKERSFADFLRWSGFMMPYARTDDALPWIRAFLEHDFHWYFTLMAAAAEHQPIDPSFVQVPVTVVAGGFDVMTSMRDVVAFAEQIPHAALHVLHGTHMLPIEFPDHILELIHDVYEQAAHRARTLPETA